MTRKSDSPTTTIKDLKDVLDKATTNEIIIEIRDENTILNKDILKIMNDGKKKYIINNYNNNIINYAWIIDGKNIGNISDIDTSIKFNSDNVNEIGKLTNYADSIYLNFSHNGELPDETKIKIYVGDKYQNGDKVNAYYYNQEKRRMDNAKLNIEVVDGYAEFELKHCSEYIITMALLNQGKTINWFMIVAIVEFIIIVFNIVDNKLNLKKKPVKNMSH